MRYACTADLASNCTIKKIHNERCLTLFALIRERYLHPLSPILLPPSLKKAYPDQDKSIEAI
jgi:hypothetical protein